MDKLCSNSNPWLDGIENWSKVLELDAASKEVDNMSHKIYQRKVWRS